MPLWGKGERDDGTFSRSDFVFDPDSDTFTCPGGTRLQQYLASWQSDLAPGATGCMRKIVKTRSSGAHSAEGGKPNGFPTPNGDYAFFSRRVFQRNSVMNGHSSRHKGEVDLPKRSSESGSF